MHLVECPVTGPDAQLLLTHYFTSRELDFPPSLGTYRVTFPDPERFVPPEGVFMVVYDDGAGGGDAGDGSADENGAAVGCGGIRLLREHERERVSHASAPVYEVKHVWLEPGARGHGWAGILMTALEGRARSLGADTVVLDTNASLTGAARLYARLGYEGIEPYNDNPNATNWYRKHLGSVDNGVRSPE